MIIPNEINQDSSSEVIKSEFTGILFENCEKKHYEVSLLIGTYNPDYKKLFITINSGLLQKNIDLQIVISDDGSQSFELDKLIEFFETKQFHNYVIVSLAKNGGTTRNYNNGLRYCKGDYTKLISPGDYLNGEDCLATWYEYIKNNNAVVSFSDCIHYYYENDEVKTVSVKSDPQNNKNFYRNSWAYNYLVFDDIVTGACTLASTEKLQKYSDLLLGKVIYAEDNIYRLMAYNNEPACYYDKDTVLYEHGSGVSTNGNKKWLERIFADYVAADSIMLEWNKDSVVAKRFAKIANIRKEKRVVLRKFKVLFFLISSGKYKFVLKRKFKPRYTNVSIDMDYVNQIHNTGMTI